MNLRYFIAIVFFMTNLISIHSYDLSCVYNQKTTCDECIKCGGIWCKDPRESRKCVPSTGGGDDWCPYDTETFHLKSNPVDGKVFQPQYDDVLAEINSGTVKTIKIVGYSPTKSTNKPYAKILSTTQSADKSKVTVAVSKQGSTIQVITTVGAGFCPPGSGKFEYVSVEVGMPGVAEKAVLKYAVPCSCGCSEVVETGAEDCNKLGNLVCGICQCNDGRRGKFCECGEKSSSCNLPLKCNGNGYCDSCNTCQCYNDSKTEGSQYYDPADNCKDLSSTVAEFLDCSKIKDALCRTCDRDVVFQKWDNNLLNGLYDASRKLWIDLGPKLPGYWGSIINSTIHVMRKCP